MKSILLLACLYISITGSGQTKELRLSSDVWPPFTDVDSAHAFAIDLVTEALARSDVHVHQDIVKSGELMEKIRNGASDGSAALWKSAERETFLLFSEPYLENRLILVGKKGTDVSATSLSGLKGKRVAVVASYAYGLTPADTKNITLVKGSSDQQNLESLLNGKADYMLVDALLIEYLLEYQSREVAQYLEIGANTLLTQPLHFAIRKDVQGAEHIIQTFNAEIRLMIVQGVYNKILKLNWIATDVDGDGKTELVLSGNEAGLHAPSKSYLVRTNPGDINAAAHSFYIEGVHYSDWSKVPDRYKVPPKPISNSDVKGFGPVFHF